MGFARKESSSPRFSSKTEIISAWLRLMVFETQTYNQQARSLACCIIYFETASRNSHLNCLATRS
jgi:hypothetical protein